MEMQEQLQLLNEVDSVIIPRDVYIDYKRLQSLEKKLKENPGSPVLRA